MRVLTADRSHDALIRDLLRASAMRGDVVLSLRTEPGYFDAMAIGGQHYAVIALDGERVVALGGVTVRPRYLNGRVARVGYLERLRLADSHAGRFDLVRRGYAVLGDVVRTLDVAACFTSVATDNARARRLLERGVRGLPAYRPVGGMTTAVIGTGGLRSPLPVFWGRVRRGATGCTIDCEPPLGRAPSLTLLRSTGRGDQTAAFVDGAPVTQFAPHWTPAEVDRAVEQFGMHADVVHPIDTDGRPAARGAVWDQRAFKQAVVTRYASRLRLWRPLHNAAAYLTGRGVRLPPPGRPLAHVFASRVVAPPDRPNELIELTHGLAAAARGLNADAIALGLDARDPRWPALTKAFRPYLYRTRLYAVHWPGLPAVVPDGRPLGPEIATL